VRAGAWIEPPVLCSGGRRLLGVDSAAERFRVAVELHETGLAMQRATLRRRNPDASDEEVDALMRAWLLERPLDCPGRADLPTRSTRICCGYT
jgi:hypothetical protein